MGFLDGMDPEVRGISPTAKGSAKFLVYFQLLDAFAEPGCPVCRRLEQGALKALDALLYEQVNDPLTRRRLVRSHGLCNWHAWLLPRVQSSALGVAVIYHHLLKEALKQLQATMREIRPRTRRKGLWNRVTGADAGPLAMLEWRRKRTRCPLCSFAGRSERGDLRTILDHMGEPDFAEAFARSTGLCLPHLYGALAIGGDHANLPILLAAHEQRWQGLMGDLAEFTRKFDYRYAHEAMGDEKKSWHRALETFVGRAGIFGPERRQ